MWEFLIYNTGRVEKFIKFFEVELILMGLSVDKIKLKK